jgi:hypothetical protein
MHAEAIDVWWMRTRKRQEGVGFQKFDDDDDGCFLACEDCGKVRV